MRHLLYIFCFCSGLVFLCHSCRREIASVYPALLSADSMMWSNPDSALLVLEQIPDSRELRGEERALYALLLTQARYKSCVLLETITTEAESRNGWRKHTSIGDVSIWKIKSFRRR
ncbi:hypothetical protein ABHZ54_09840 [Bacteroides uniformis]